MNLSLTEALTQALETTRLLRQQTSALLSQAETRGYDSLTRRQIEQAWNDLTLAGIHLENALENAKVSPQKAFAE